MLAAVGIYGIMAYSVQQRTQEVGIRMALGASPQDVRRMMVMQGMVLAFIGVMLGVPAGWPLRGLMGSLLYGVKPWDPIVFIVTADFTERCGAVCLLIPARRASREDPMVALRYE